MLLPQVIPSFAATWGGLRELWDLRKVFGVASRVMQPRQASRETHKDFFYDLFEITSKNALKLVRAGGVRRLRQSV